MKILPADLIFTHSNSILGKSISYFETGYKESPAYATHVAGIGNHDNVVEASIKVIDIEWSKWGENVFDFQLWRKISLTMTERFRIAQYAESQVGKKYGALKIIPHAMDGVLSKFIGGSPYIFRRICFIKDYPICSWLWAYGFNIVGEKFGGEPNELDPDDMHDYCVSNPMDWIRIL